MTREAQLEAALRAAQDHIRSGSDYDYPILDDIEAALSYGPQAEARTVTLSQALRALNEAAYAAIREAALKEAASECQRIAGNTKDFHAYHRRAAGQCTSRILAMIGEKK